MTGWWLSLPLWKIWVRQLGLFFPIYGKKTCSNQKRFCMGVMSISIKKVVISPNSISNRLILLSTSSSRPWASVSSSEIWKKRHGWYEWKATMATIIFFRNTWLCKESFLLIIFTPKVHLFWPERTRITDGDPQPHAPDFYRCHHPDDPDRSLPSQIWKTMLNPSILPIKCCHTVKLQIFNDLQHDFILCCSTFSILFYSFFRSDQVTADFAPPIPPWAAPSEIMWRKGNAYQPMYIYILSI